MEQSCPEAAPVVVGVGSRAVMATPDESGIRYSGDSILNSPPATRLPHASYRSRLFARLSPSRHPAREPAPGDVLLGRRLSPLSGAGVRGLSAARDRGVGLFPDAESRAPCDGPYHLQDYRELVDWSGRAIIEGKRGKIPDDLPPILARLKIDPGHYVRFINRTQKSRFHGFIGSVKSMRGLAGDFGRSFVKGQAAAAALFSPG